jgi:hypothetical protein
MSKLKRMMGAGSLMTVLFGAPITVINQPTPALSQTVEVSRGSTPVGTTAWQQYFVSGAGGGVFEKGVFVDVNTSSAGLTTTPIYITSLGGNGGHWVTTGATSIYSPTPTGFRVYVRLSNGGELTPAMANQYGWHINWIAVPK